MNNFSILNSYTSLKEFLKKELFFSNSIIKKENKKKYFDLKVNEKSSWQLGLNLRNNGIVSPLYTGKEIEILYDDKDFIVVNKPAFTHGHALSYEESDTILNFLRNSRILPWLGQDDGEKEKGLLYRLDVQTSGVLIYVKNKLLHKKLRDEFSNIATKEYFALVQGQFDQDGETIHFLKGSEQKGSCVVESGDGRKCRAYMSLVKTFDKYSLVKINLQTGFRHQIRVQLSLLGFPIVGDELYGGEAAPRIFLHAYKYSLSLDGELKSWESKQDLLFNDFLNLDCRFDVL